METDAKRVLSRLGLRMRLQTGLPLAAAALSGCAVYGPPYAAYDSTVAAPAPVVAPYYGYPYGYGRPLYAGPPLSLNFGYYEHGYRGGYGGYRGYGYRGYRGHHGGDYGGNYGGNYRGHGWHGAPGGHAHGWGGGRGGGHGGGPRGGGRGHR